MYLRSRLFPPRRGRQKEQAVSSPERKRQENYIRFPDREEGRTI